MNADEHGWCFLSANNAKNANIFSIRVLCVIRELNIFAIANAAGFLPAQE